MSTRKAAPWAPLVRPSFLICVAVLATAAVFAGPMAKRWKKVFIKEPIYCRKPLSEMSRTGYGPYVFVRSDELSKAVVDSLGTTRYINWVFADSRKPEQSPLRLIFLTVTYYTGGPNLAPHVPDICMRGAGYRIEEAENIEFEVPSLGPDGAIVPVRTLTFVKSDVQAWAKPTVTYTFHANGEFTATRTGVRTRTSNLGDRFAYFSKVEVAFAAVPGAGSASRDDAVEAAREFMTYILPELVEEHWPDWEALDQGKVVPAAAPERST